MSKKNNLYTLIKNKIFNKNNKSKKGDSIVSLVANNKQDSSLSSENSVINNIISFRDKRANNIMVPRVDILAIEEKSDIEDLLEVISKTGFSRLPVFRENLDHVTGFLHVKDVIPALRKHSKVELHKMVRSVLFVSPHMRLFDLLYEMNSKRVHMAIVVDEFGGVDGLITLEDIVEEIIGDIRDEYDKAPTFRILEKSRGVLEVDGRVDVDDLEQYTGVFTTEEEKQEFNTVSGLIASLVGSIPEKNDVIQHPSGIEFQILSVDPLKINKVIVNYTNIKELTNKSDN